MLRHLKKTPQKYLEILRFGIVGVLATAIHYIVYYILLYICSVNIAYSIGYVVSFCFNLILSSRFTFKSNLTIKKSVGFGLSHLFNYLLQIIVLNICVGVGIQEKIAPVLVYAVCIPINFLLVRYVFKRK